MKYLLLALLILPTDAGSGAGDMSSLVITEVQQTKLCKIDNFYVNCAYLYALILRETKRCPECDWKTKKI